MTEDEMVGWHHRLKGHEFEQAPGVGDGWESLVCCSPWSQKELDTRVTELISIFTFSSRFVGRFRETTMLILSATRMPAGL